MPRGLHRRPSPTGTALLASSGAFALAVLSTTVVNVALPAMRRDLGGGVSGLQWVANGYTLMLASLLLSMGVLCDRRGARRVMLAGLGLFLAGGALAAAAPTLGVLVVAQLIKGAGGAALVPAALSLLSHAYAGDLRRQARAVAYVSGSAAVATGAGPVLAGLLIGAFGWRAVFAIDIVMALVIAWPVLRHLPETPRSATGRVDVPGQVLGIVALAALTFAFIRSGSTGWSSAETLGPLALALVAGGAFVAVEERSRAPMLPPWLLRMRTFDATSASAALVNFAFYGQLFVLTLYLQDVRGLSPLDTGWVFVALPATSTGAAVIAARMTGRYGARLPSVLGCAIGALAMVVLSTMDAATPFPILIGGLMLMGLGPGLAVPAMTAGLVAGIPRSEAGIATAAFTTCRQVGGLLGVAVLGTIVGAGDFVPRMQTTLLLAAGALLLAAAAATQLTGGRPDDDGGLSIAYTDPLTGATASAAAPRGERRSSDD